MFKWYFLESARLTFQEKTRDRNGTHRGGIFKLRYVNRVMQSSRENVSRAAREISCAIRQVRLCNASLRARGDNIDCEKKGRNLDIALPTDIVYPRWSLNHFRIVVSFLYVS